MEKELWFGIQKGNNVRQNLSSLRQQLKKEGSGAAFGRQLNEADIVLLKEYLYSEDAKIRKNTALLLGECSREEFLSALMDAYQKETQMFVKSAYLTALRNYDCKEFQIIFKERYEQLSKEEASQENKKHRDEELKALSALMLEENVLVKHTFRGLKEESEIVLFTNRAAAELTAQQVEQWNSEAQTTVFGPNVLVKAGSIHWRNQIRTYKEMLFRIKGMEVCPADPEAAAQKAAASGLTAFLEKTHKGGFPFGFRVEVRGTMEPAKKAAFAKKMAVGIERLTKRKLVNSVSDYEVTIRLTENKKGTYTALVKLSAVEDERFSYRKEYTAESIKPVNAAIAVQLAKPYLKEDAQVLDPFCGVGTMLIERYKAVRANTSYGIDYKAEAIAGARANTKAAGQIVHYVHKNFFEFTHEYLFDEIITDMPFALGQKSKEDIRVLYRSFFPAAHRVLKADGTMILYTRDRGYVRQMAPLAGFVLAEEFEISPKEETWLMILKKRSA